MASLLKLPTVSANYDGSVSEVDTCSRGTGLRLPNTQTVNNPQITWLVADEGGGIQTNNLEMKGSSLPLATP